MIKIKMPVTVSVHVPGKRWPGTEIFRFGCAQRNRFLAPGSCFHNRITKYAPCGLRFLGESNLDFHLSRQFPVRLCTKPGPRSNTKQLFEYKNRFPLLEIGVLRHPVNGFERFSAVFSAECAHCVTRFLAMIWTRCGWEWDHESRDWVGATHPTDGTPWDIPDHKRPRKWTN